MVYSIPLCYSNSGQAFNLGHTVWGRVSGRVFMRTQGIASWSRTIVHCILKQNCYRHCLCRCCSYTSKLIIKPDDEPGFYCLSIPYCQWQYSTVYAMRVSTKPSLFWEWLSIALFCSYQSWYSDIPRKIFKRLSDNLLNLVSYYANLLHAMNLLFRLKLMLVVFPCSRYVGLVRISWDCWGFTLANTYWRANRESQDSSGDIKSLMHPHA